MTALTEIFLAVLELIKAELQQSKIGFFSFFVAVILFLVGMSFFAAALVLVLISIGLALDRVFSTSVTILVMGIIAALFGLTLIFIGSMKSKR